MTTANGATWYVVHVEDDVNTLRQVKEYLEGEDFDFGQVRVAGTSEFDDALTLLGERKVDLLILDVYRGDPSSHDAAGVDVLSTWRAAGFAPVVLHTALPERLDVHAGPFVHIVTKEAGSLVRLSATIRQLFSTNIPQIHRAIVNHLDVSLRDYMWGFVVKNWSQISSLTRQPDFIRLLLRRLGLQFASDVAATIRRVYPDSSPPDPSQDTVHPVEYYVRPPIGEDPKLGDLRLLGAGDDEQLVVVLWPSCDLVHRGDQCKVERALCARLRQVEEFEEYTAWATDAKPNKKKERALLSLMENVRKAPGTQPERYHFLPGAWDMRARVADFGDLMHVPVADLRKAPCIATVASPFAESISSRLVRYLGRLGTPDLDREIVLGSLRPDSQDEGS